MRLFEEFKLYENLFEDAAANLTEDVNSTDIDYSILTDTLNDALEFAATDPGQRNNVLVYAVPGTDVFAECKKWAAVNGINLVYIKTPTANYEELASDKFTTAKTVLFFKDFDQAGAESKAAVISLLDSVYFDGRKNILFSIADCSIDSTLSTHEQNAFTFDILLEGCVNNVQIENKLTSLTESTTIYTDDGKIAARFYSANESVQDYVDDVGPYNGGYTLINEFWLPTNRGKLNVGLISLDESDGEEGLVCLPSYDVQFVAPIDEAEDVYDMLYDSEAFDDIDAFIAKFVRCSYAKSVERLLDSGVGHLTEGITNNALTWTCFFDDEEIGTVEAATVAEEFKSYENLFDETTSSKKHPWMKDVSLIYPELNMGSNSYDPEDEILIKDFAYLEGPEDVAEVLHTLITEEDIAGTGYDFQTIKADLDAWYDFLDANFDKLVTKYDEELLNAFENRAIKAAISEAEDYYYNGNSEYIHETLMPDHDTDIKIVKDVRNILKELGSGESYIHGSWNQDFVILSGEDRTNSSLRNALKNLGCTELANIHDVNKLLIPKTFKHTDNSLDEAGSKKEDNLARMRRQIRHEIAQLEAEKAADTDPTSAYYYDEKIKACWAELRELGRVAPTPATARKRAIKAEQEEKAKEISRFLRYAFMGLSKYFGPRPRCETLKSGGLIIVFKKELTPAAAAGAIDICAKASIPIKHKENSSRGSVFEVDAGNLNIHGSFSLNDIDTDAIEARLEAEQNNNVNNETEINEQGSLKENTTMNKTQYQLQLQAWNKKYYEDSYTDNDATGNTYGDLYEYVGDLGSIIKKLNTISKKYEFSFINIYVNGTDECVFDAGTTDSTAEEDEFGDLPEVDENTVFINKVIPESAPFMKQFIIGPKGKYTPNSLAEACEYEYELTDIDKRFLDHIRYKAQQNKLTQAPKQVFDISKYPGKRVNCCLCGTECIDNSDVTGIPVEYVAYKTVFGPCCAECFEYGDDDLIQSTNSFIMATSEADWLETRFDLADAAEQRAAIVELAGLISAWNTAKKDARFVYTKAEAKELEKEFISNTAEAGFEIDPRIFNLNQDTAIIASKINSELTESYRRVVSRGKALVDNPLFVDFD